MTIICYLPPGHYCSWCFHTWNFLDSLHDKVNQHKMSQHALIFVCAWDTGFSLGDCDCTLGFLVIRILMMQHLKTKKSRFLGQIFRTGSKIQKKNTTCRTKTSGVETQKKHHLPFALPRCPVPGHISKQTAGRSHSRNDLGGTNRWVIWSFHPPSPADQSKRFSKI